MTNYLLISSTYRDRLLYPNPADFVIPFGSNNIASQTFNAFTTTNPITFSFPEYNNCWTNFNSANPKEFHTKIISMNTNSVSVADNVNTDLLGIVKEEPPQTILFKQSIENCYDILRGFFLQIRIEGILYSRLIEGYDPITSTIILRNSFPIVEVPNEGYDAILYNSFELSPINPLNEGLFITINGDFLKDSPLIYYDSDVFVYNINQNEFRKTVQYEQEFHKYLLEKPFTSMKPTDQYFLFGNSNSSFSGTIDFLPIGHYYTFVPASLVWYSRGSGYNTTIRVRLENGQQNPDEYYHEFIISNTGVLGEISDDILNLVKVGKQTFQKNSMYRIVPVQEEHNGQMATIKINSYSLAFSIRFKNEQPLPQSLVGMYFLPIVMSKQYQHSHDKLIFQPNGTIMPKNIKSTQIDLLTSQSINGVTAIKQVFVNEKNEYVIVTQQYSDLTNFNLLAQAKTSNTIPSYCEGIENFLILNFSSEGVVPLNYSGSQITQSQMSCYELSITSLILPNVILQTTSGLLTSAYPFLFVEISNESSPNSGNTDIIYSNNPHATKSTFVCPTLDVNNPETTKFIKVGHGSGSQIMKFTPYDNLRIRISLPNGETFKTEMDDNLVPNSPNLRLQITLLVELKRL